MCSCSGSCNCNSTTIPKGPTGPQGPKGDKGDTGDTGSTGNVGPQGVNAFSPLTSGFTQPDFSTPINIDATPTSWMGIKQIVYISSNTTIGGFYQINSKTGTTVNVTRLDWSSPNVTFITTGSLVPSTSYIIPSGTIGPAGYTSIERIKADVYDNPGTGFNALINVPFDELDADGKIITFTITSSTEDSSGVFAATGFSISDGVTTTSLFNLGSTAPNYGILPAKIKFDRNPALSPSGYESNQYINFVKADIKISRISSSSATIEGVIYGYNVETQDTFGLARFPQKIWHLNTGFSYPEDFTIISSTSDDGSGGSTGMTNILRYNTTL